MSEALKMTRIEALTRALYLGIIAATDDQEERASSLAEDLAFGMLPEEVQQAMAAALRKAGL